MEQTSEQQRIMRECRRHFLETGEVDPRVRLFVGESWLRCRQYDHDHILPSDISLQVDMLSEKDLKRKLDENRMLLQVARPVLMKLANMVAGTQYVVTLHDVDGWILDTLFSGENPTFSVSYYKSGIRWAEDTIGTCSSHMAAILDQEVQLVGHEHYHAQLCGLVGTAAPLHDSRGNLIGCLNLCGYYSEGCTYGHSLSLVKAMAMLIESRLEAVLTSQLLRDTFDVLSDGIILLDTHYQVLEVSTQAAAILKMPRTAIYALDIRELFRYEDFEQQLQSSDAPFSYTECELDAGTGTVTCNIQVIPLVSRGHRNGFVLKLRDHREAAKRRAAEAAGNQASYCFSDIITQDPALLQQIDTMKDIAVTDCCVLIEGESGTGKELFAHSLHSASARKEGPFIAVNCASLPRGLVESELFGYEKGAFTGARSSGNPGKFELAEGGTIFLDEIGELPLETQATLLRVLDNHKVARVGGVREKNLDVRVIAATNRNLYREVQSGAFRSDLYFRINVLQFDIPPLRERAGDAVLLAQTFLKRINSTTAAQRKTFSTGFLNAVNAYSWPGNVRELKNTVTRAYYSSKGPLITESALPQELMGQVQARPAEEAAAPQAAPPAAGVIPGPLWGEVAEAERQVILQALLQTGGNVELAAMQLRMSRTTLYRRIKKYQIFLK